MKRPAIALLAALALLAAATASAAAATKQTQVAGNYFESDDGSVAAIGAVRSPAAKCADRRKVVLVANRIGGRDKRLGTDLASRNGGVVIYGTPPENYDALLLIAPPKKVSKRLDCAPGSVEITSLNPN